MSIEKPADEKTMAEEIAHPERIGKSENDNSSLTKDITSRQTVPTKRENKPPLGRHDSWSRIDHTDVNAVFSYIDEQRSKGTNPYRNICFNPDVEQYMEMIKKPENFVGGRRNQWNEDDKANLESAKEDYKIIHAQDKKLQADLNNIDYLMYERGRKQAIELTEQEEGIQSRIAKIDEQLNAYEEKFKLLQAKGDDMTEEERKWLDKVMNSEIVLKLSTQRRALEDSLAKVAALHTELDEAETTITKELGERVPREFKEGCPPILPSYAIAFHMRKHKNEILEKVSKVRDIAEKAKSLFGSISQSIQKTMASITKLFTSTDRILAKSQSLLNKSPEPSHQMERNTAPK